MTDLSGSTDGSELAARLEYVERQLASLWRQTYHGRQYMPYFDAAVPLPGSREAADVPTDRDEGATQQEPTSAVGSNP